MTENNDEILETEILAMKMFPELRLQIETFTMQKKRIEELEAKVEYLEAQLEEEYQMNDSERMADMRMR